VRRGRPADLDAAKGLISKNLEENPKSPEDNQVLASILAIQVKTRGQAVKILEPLDREKRLGPDDQFLLAQLYCSQREEKKYEDEMLKILVAGKSTNPLFLGHYIAYLIQSKQLDLARSWLAELKKLAPESVATLELEAMLLKARNPGKTTLPEVRDLLVERGRTYPDLIGPVASLLGGYGFPIEAEAAYKELMARDPGKPEGELALASFLATQKGRLEEALEHLSHARKTCPLEQVAYAALKLYDAPSVTESQRKQVEAWVNEASQRRPDLTVLANKRAALWIRQGRFDEAEAVYRRILSSDSDNSEALNNLAWLLALRDQGKAEEAVELINRAIDQQGPTASLVDTKAVALIRGGRSREAIEELRAAATGTRNASIPLHLAWALQNEGKLDEARKAFQKAVEQGWKPERSDPLERSFMEKLRQELGL
jgi:tetratricopeptide (TPR) repeat protein